MCYLDRLQFFSMSQTKPPSDSANSNLMEAKHWLVSLMENEVPFNKYLGLKVDAIREGHAVVRLPYNSHWVGDYRIGRLHGGVTSALADLAGGTAVWTYLGQHDSVSTVDLRVDYLEPAKQLDLIAEANVIRKGRHLGVCNIHVRQGLVGQSQGVLVAEAKGVYAIRERSET